MTCIEADTTQKKASLTTPSVHYPFMPPNYILKQEKMFRRGKKLRYSKITPDRRKKAKNLIWLGFIYVDLKLLPARHTSTNQITTHTHRNGSLPFISHSVILASWLTALDECFYPESKQDSETMLILPSWVKLKPIIPLSPSLQPYCATTLSRETILPVNSIWGTEGKQGQISA